MAADLPGFSDGEFAFTVGGISGQSLVIEASTNMVTWISLLTNMMEMDGWSYRDLASTNFASRLYRVRVVE